MRFLLAGLGSVLLIAWLWSLIYQKTLSPRKLRLLPLKQIRLPLQIAVIFLTIVFASLVANRSSKYLDKSPIVTDDDIIANVAVNLWQNSTYGYLASPSVVHFGTASEPILKWKHFDGSKDYYNYGWFYFGIAGFFNWLIGDNSLLFFRMMNPWGLIVVGFVGFWLFRRESYLPGVILTTCILGKYLSSVAPIMGRPDIGVSIASAILLFFSTYAIRKNTPLLWFMVGFWGATAATTHPVAWPIAPATSVIWCYFAVTERKSRRDTIKSLLLTTIGGCVGISLYLWMMNFRILDLWSFVSYLKDHLPSKSISNQLIDSLKIGWSGSILTFAIGISGITSGLFLIFASKKIPDANIRVGIRSVVLPPVVLALAYLFGLSTYRSLLHPTYGIFVYVSALWCFGATIAASILLLKLKYEDTICEYLNLLAVILLCFVITQLNYFVPVLEKQSYGNVSFKNYERQVWSSIPQKSYSWGSVTLGMRAGIEFQFIDISSGLAFAMHHDQKYWPKISPEFVLLNYFNLEMFFFAGPAKLKDGVLAFLSETTGRDNEFRSMRVIYAPPYGNTFVFQRSSVDESRIAPTFSFNDGIDPMWVNVGNSLKIDQPKLTDPVIIDSRPKNGLISAAKKSFVIPLEAGNYFIRLKVPRKPTQSTAAIVFTPDRYYGIDDDVRLIYGPLLKGSTETEFVFQHNGGNAYFSYFDGESNPLESEGIAINVTELIKIGNQDKFPNQYSLPLKLPSLSSWNIKPSEIKSSNINMTDERLEIFGTLDNYNVTLISPVISLPPNEIFSMKIPHDIDGALVKVKILNPSGLPIMAKPESLIASNLSFQTPRDGMLKIEISISKGNNNDKLNIKLGAGQLTSHKFKNQNETDILKCPTMNYPRLDSDKPCIEVTDEVLKKIDDILK
jgi:hypothetical protein